MKEQGHGIVIQTDSIKQEIIKNWKIASKLGAIYICTCYYFCTFQNKNEQKYPKGYVFMNNDFAFFSIRTVG